MKVVVVGDVLLDVDIAGRADRLSPDAPVPVIEVEKRLVRAGGAGLVAALLQRDGCAVELVTVLSADDRAEEMRLALGSLAVVSGDSGAPTPVKTRLGAHGHPLARFDDGCGRPPVPRVTEWMLASIRSADAVIVADYGRRLLENERLRAVLSEVGDAIPVVWDPHPRGARPIPGAAVVTPNRAEALAFASLPASPASAATPSSPSSVGDGADGAEEAAGAAASLRAEWGVGAVVVTLGSRGAVLVGGADTSAPHTLFPAPAVHVTDPCGAGDRFAATLARELGRGTVLPAAVESAVAEAAEFLASGGVSALEVHQAPAPVERLFSVPPPLPGAGRPAAVTALDTALAIAEKTRIAGGTVVATGGCFDILHAGHARTLRAARELGDCLIVCLNSDESITRLKGPERPIQNEADRAELLLSLGVVDAVMVFEEDTPESVLGILRPDVWVKGGDYSVDELPESRLLATWGGRTVTVPFHPGRSTTKLAFALARVS